tara:strand:+ start:160 stop:2286 length:2127 start_codon:yes stop_codon:yes gene_type:complete
MAEPRYRYGGDSAIGALLLPERREILQEEQNQFIGYDDRGQAIVQTLPAQYGESEVDFSYSPIVRGAKATGSFLNDIFFGDANEQSEAAGRAVSAVRGVVGGLGDYASSQYEAGMAGGTTYDPETRQITEFDPALVMGGGSSGGGPALASGFRRSGNKTSNQTASSQGQIGKRIKSIQDERARLKRAQDLGFDTDNPIYHSTNASFDSFELPDDRFLKYGQGVYASPSPEYADRYIREGRKLESGYKEGANVVPMYARGKIGTEQDWETARQEMLAEGISPTGYGPMQEEIKRRLQDKGFDGLNMFGDEIIIYDPKNLRSINADFNPAMSDSDTLLYSGGGRQGSAIAGGSALRNEFERQFGGAIPEVTRDTPLLKRVGDPASINEMTVEMSSPQISSVPIVKAEDLIDRPYITGMSDTSRSGLERVTSVNDVPVDVLMRGGKYFGAQPENIERGVAFASAPNAVMGQLNRAAAAQSLGGRPVAFIPYGMMPTSPDFATMTTDLMVPYARQVMSKSDKKALDKRIRSGANSMTDEFTPIPDWVGIDKADEEYLANLGGLRKAVEKSLDEFRDAGSLNLSQARAIVTDPTQFNPAFGDIDMIYELNPEAVKNRTFLESNHPSYPAALAGRPLGALRDTEKANIFEFDVLAGTADTEFYNFRDAELAKGRPFEIGGKLKSPTMKAFAPGGHGKITQDMVDDLIRRGLVIP